MDKAAWTCGCCSYNLQHRYICTSSYMVFKYFKTIKEETINSEQGERKLRMKKNILDLTLTHKSSQNWNPNSNTRHIKNICPYLGPNPPWKYRGTVR